MSSKWIVFGLAALCLALAALGSARSALADYLWRSQRIEALIRLEPSHLPARLARGLPEDLQRAAAVGPSHSAALLELALAAERRGDLAAAKAYLEEAARRDATFAPRWALVNFLARHGEPRQVLETAAPAAAIYEGDLSALFDLCLRSGLDPGHVYHAVVPQRAKAQREFLEVMIRHGRHVEALGAALRLADLANPRDRDLLLDYCDRLLGAGAGSQAAKLWNAMPRRGDPRGRCLAWKAQAVAGVVVIEANATAVRLALSGRQPQSAGLLKRAAIVEPGRRYHLRAIVSGDATMKKAVEWRWNGGAVGTGEEADIEVEATREICELELAIRRRPGERAAEGEVEITNIAVQPKSAALAQLGSRAVWRPTIFQALPSLTHIIMK